MSKCIILGAGASHGYDSLIPETDKPPLGKKIISNAIKTGFLSEERYHKLSKIINLYMNAKELSEKEIDNVDIEDVLAWAAYLDSTPYSDMVKDNPSKFDEESSLFPDYKEQMDNYIKENISEYLSWPSIKDMIQKDTNLRSELIEKRTNILKDQFRLKVADYLDESRLKGYDRTILHNGIGESWYLMFELFKYYSMMYKPNFDAYQKLALHYLREKYSVISLNFDIIFEMAILYSQMSFSYPLIEDPILKNKTPLFPPSSYIWPDSSKTIYISKIHGSINWFNPVLHSISVGAEVNDLRTLLDKLGGLPYTNKFRTSLPKIISPIRLHEITLRDLFPKGDEFYEPMLVPPIGNFKDYKKFDYVHRNFMAAAWLLSSANELVIIGASLRSQDEDLMGLVKNNSKNIRKVTIVAHSQGQALISKISEILNAGKMDFELFNSFEDYAKTF
ncbi:MAG: hypothetical protein JRN66_08160 [Nitrososphaerota archaeon]|jgi:hypothetical protein|nr:hypothetical protein [Nitrososphaerota archaeon]